jgi:hypothetical protein
MTDRKNYRGRCWLFIQLPAARATERCAAIAVKKATGELAQGGRFLAVVSLTPRRGKIAFATLDFFSAQLWLKSPLDFCPLFLKKGDK